MPTGVAGERAAATLRRDVSDHGDAGGRRRSAPPRPWSPCRRCRRRPCRRRPSRRRRRGRRRRGPRVTSVGRRPRAGRRRRGRRRRRAAPAGRRAPGAATSAASRSLSPNRISSVATVSFSLTIGQRRRARAAGRACAGRCGSARAASTSSAVSSTWPTVMPCAREGLGVAVHEQALADAGRRLLGGEVARAGGQAERREPAAIAPEDTSTTSPAATRAACRERVDERVDARRRRCPPSRPSVQRGRADLDHDARRAARVARRLRRCAGHGSAARRGAGRVPRGPVQPLGAGRRASGSQSKTTPSSPPMTTSAPGSAPGLDQRVLDAEPGQPVGEVADGLVVGEVGLPHPALGLARRGRG